MKFDTYHIDGNNDVAVEAAAKNGLVEIKFYKEEQVYNSRGFSTFTTSNCNTRHYDYATLRNTGMVFSSPGIFSQETDMSFSDDNTTNAYYSATLDSCDAGDLSDYVCESTSDVDYNDFVNEHTKSLKSKKLETGRVEKGEESNQTLKTEDVTFSYNPFHTLIYEMKPISTKPQNINEVRNYCPMCKYRIRKSNWNYCPKCSAEL